MFVWRFFKRIVFLGVFGSILYAASGYVEIHGRPARLYAQEFMQSSLWKEGTKDMRTWLAAILRVASTKIEEGVTVEDQAKLNSIIESDLQREINSVKDPELRNQLQHLKLNAENKQ